MDTSRVLKFVLIIEMVILLCNAIAISRDYQDTWILEGLEVTFAVFMITYLAYFTVEKKLSWLLLFALIVRFTVLVLPSLKYTWFMGSARDQHRHYRLTQDIFEQGFIREDLYSGTPFMHLSFVIYSMITGLDYLVSFKVFPIIPWLLFPVITYLLINRIAVENTYIKKCAIFISSIPVRGSISFIVVGTLFAPLWIYLILYNLTKNYWEKDRRTIILLVIFGISLAATHTMSSITFSILLSVVYLLWRFFRQIGPKIGLMKTLIPSYIPASLFVIIILICVTWYSFTSNARDLSLVGLSSYIAEALGFFEGRYAGFIAERFFEIGSLNGLKVILVANGADLFLILTTTIGFLVILFQMRKKQMQRRPELMLLSFYVVSIVLFMFIGVALDIGWQWYDRMLWLFLITPPIFMAIALQYLKIKTTPTIPIFLMGLLLVVSTIQLFPYQPLIPASSSYSKDLPDDEPIVYFHGVNTIYQREMITFAEQYFPVGTRIACDTASHRLLIGLTSVDFSQGYIYYYPLSDEESRNYDIFLIHLPGKSGAFLDKAEFRTKSLILSAIYQSNIIYTNGESYILSGP